MLAEAEHQQALAQKAELEELRGKKVEHDYSGHHEGHALAGHSYEVRINAHPDHFLDWDKPLKDQHEHVQKAIRSLPYGNIKWLEDTPNLYAALEDARSSWMQQQGHDTRGYQKHKVGVSDDLRQAGLPGVKYLDQGSVNAAHKGTRNYVVFDDKLVNVKRKYAKGGSVNEYPLDDDADEHLHSGGHMTWMSPDSFLNKAEEMRGDSDDKKAIKHFEKRIEEGDKLNPLALYPKGGQDGRHRATAAKHEGIKKIPVVQWDKRARGGSIVDRALMLTSKKA
jgi:acyl-CoA thioesterase FadM